MANTTYINTPVIRPARQQLLSAKRAFSTRRITENQMHSIVTDKTAPRVGDLVLAKVTELGQHKRIELTDGRRATLYEGDEIILAYGERYAPDQFESMLPESLEPCHMAAAGGVASKVLSWNKRISRPTSIEPLGFVANEKGERLNLKDFRLESFDGPSDIDSVIVVGTSMNAGKTTTAANIIYGLRQAGRKVAGIKITGTGAGGDLWLMQDSGAAITFDFTDAGLPTTYNISRETLFDIPQRLMKQVIAHGCDAVVIEIADGIYQPETRALLTSPSFRNQFNHVVFAARESMSAVAGVRWLEQQGFNVVGLGGLIMQSPLSVREAKMAASVPCFDLADLRQPHNVEPMLTRPERILSKAANL